MKNMVAYIVLLLVSFRICAAQCPDYSEPGPYAHAYRTVSIPGEGETMNNSRIYYPSSGGAIPSAATPCPLVIFAHGWQLGIDRYYSYAERLASRGYIVTLPAFSSPLIIPDHDRRARLLIYALHFVNALNYSSGDIFEGNLDVDNWSMVGHSMGGSLSMLVGDRYTNFPDSVFHIGDTLRAIVVLASPQSDPVANDANVTTPKMILAGTEDGIAPWEDVRAAFWADAPPPGVFAVIDGANHCQFNDYYGGCDEFDGSPDITRDEQQQIARRHITAFLNRYQMGDTTNCNFLYTYGDSLTEAAYFDSVEVRYVPVSVEEHRQLIPSAFSLKAYPNPFNSSVNIVIVGAINLTPLQMEIFDINGRKVYENFPFSRINPGCFLTPVTQSFADWGQQSFHLLNGDNGSGDSRNRKGEFAWQPNQSLPSGIYLIKVNAVNYHSSEKVIYLK
ncbi:hypothetical protein JXI42_11215 [bacterium]|nr:hypothetical protein [bacterium]